MLFMLLLTRESIVVEVIIILNASRYAVRSAISPTTGLLAKISRYFHFLVPSTGVHSLILRMRNFCSDRLNRKTGRKFFHAGPSTFRRLWFELSTYGAAYKCFWRWQWHWHTSFQGLKTISGPPCTAHMSTWPARPCRLSNSLLRYLRLSETALTQTSQKKTKESLVRVSLFWTTLTTY